LEINEFELTSALCHTINMAKNPKRPRDPNQLAKLIVDIATGEEGNSHPEPMDAKKRKAGLKGGNERAKSLTPEKRKEIAQKAAAKRWEQED
jgi:hypothetical protein